MFRDGYLSIGRWRGAPIRLHWTLPLGAFVLGQLEIVPGFWVAFVTLIFLHELGHAIVIRGFRQRVLSIDIHGLGGACRWVGAATPMQRALIAWGGIWGQLALLVATHVALFALGPPVTVFQVDVVRAFVSTNIFLMALNLLPIPPLDGAEAWRVVPLLYGRAKQALARRRHRRRVQAVVRRERQMIRAAQVEDEDVELTPEVKAVVDDLLGRIDPKRRGKG